MSEFEIKISPFNCDFFYLSFEDSYRFGVETGIIYTFRLFNKYECDNLENGPNFYNNLAKHIDHECLHKILLDLENEEISKSLDVIAKTKDNKEYTDYQIDFNVINL